MPPTPVDDHDGQHDADEDGVKDYDEEQDVLLARSVFHDEFYPDFGEERNQERRKEEKVCHLESSCNHCRGVFSQKDVRPEEASQV